MIPHFFFAVFGDPDAEVVKQLRAKAMRDLQGRGLKDFKVDECSAQATIARDWCWMASDASLPVGGDTVFIGTSGITAMMPPSFHTGTFIKVDRQNSSVLVESDFSGAIPLYYSRSGNGVLLLSTHQRILAAATRAQVDDLGVLQFMRGSYALDGRTLFEGIRRLQPRERLRWDGRSSALTSERIRIPNSSRAEASIADVEAVWNDLQSFNQALTSELQADLNGGERARMALMMSGGWDSRTLLGAFCFGQKAAAPLLCFSHGDPQSRELLLVKLLAERMGTRCHLEEISRSMFELEQLEEYVNHCETALFPHWFAAGKLLQSFGVKCAQSGVFGELLGGHYGRTMVLRGWGKVGALLGELSGFSSQRLPEFMDELAILVIGSQPQRPWFIDSRALGGWAEADLLRHNRAELVRVLEDYAAQGLTQMDELLEWFIAEHRGTQYIAQQAYSMLPHVELSLPYAMPKLLALLRRLPFGVRVHNRLNRELLLRYCPELAALPLASTFAAAGQSTIRLEISRLLRWTTDLGQTVLSRYLPMISPPRRSWVNYRFMANGEEFSSIINTLSLPYWNYTGLHNVVEQIRRGSYRHSLHSFTEVLLKIYMVDRIISAARRDTQAEMTA